MKKTFTAGFLALALLLTGCGNDKPAPESKTVVQQENKQNSPENKPADKPEQKKELTDEEKAQQEEERKAAEEKRRAEAERREQQRKAEEEEKKARQYNEAIAKTLRITPEEFRQNFNEMVYSEGLGDLAIGDLKFANGGGRDVFQYFFNEYLWINFPIDSVTKNAKTFELLAGSQNGDIEGLRNNLILAMMIYPLAVKTANPELTAAEIDKIFDELGLTQSVGEWAKNSSSTYNGRLYTKQVIKGVGLKFTIEQK